MAFPDLGETNVSSRCVGVQAPPTRLGLNFPI